MYRYFNPNPEKTLVDDCVIRAICKVTGDDWEQIYVELSVEGLKYHDWAWKNYVWGSYLFNRGFRRTLLPDTCPICFTVKDFCKKFPEGSYLLATGDHLIAVVNGDYYDTRDSGDEVPVYYWVKEKEY